MRVLVIAYACEPNRGSEPGVGWNWVKIISKIANHTTVITRKDKKEEIEKARNECRNTNFLYVDLPKPLNYTSFPSFLRLVHYVLWLLRVLFVLKKLRRKNSFDIIHHVTFVNSWIPPIISLAKGQSKFIWGPVGENEAIPDKYALFSSFSVFVKNRIKGIIKILSKKNLIYRLALRKVDFLIGINQGIISMIEEIDRKFSRNSAVIPAIGISYEEIEKTIDHKVFEGVKEKFFVAMVGTQRLWLKGFYLGIHAFSAVSQKYNISMIVVGDEKETRRLRKRAKKLRAENIYFENRLPRKEVLKRILESSVFLYPSFEGGGQVVLEAMILGKPVICLNTGGPSEFVDEDSGIKVEVDRKNVNATIKALAEALESLIEDKEVISQMGKNARKKVELLFSWENKIYKLRRIYEKVLEKNEETF